MISFSLSLMETLHLFTLPKVVRARPISVQKQIMTTMAPTSISVTNPFQFQKGKLARFFLFRSLEYFRGRLADNLFGVLIQVLFDELRNFFGPSFFFGLEIKVVFFDGSFSDAIYGATANKENKHRDHGELDHRLLLRLLRSFLSSLSFMGGEGSLLIS